MTNYITLINALGLSISLAAPAAAYNYDFTEVALTTSNVKPQPETQQPEVSGMVEVYDYRQAILGTPLRSAMFAVFDDADGYTGDQQILTVDP